MPEREAGNSTLQMVCQCADKSKPVTIELSDQGRSAVLTISGSGVPSSDGLSQRLSELSIAANELEANVDTCCEDGTLSLVLTLPIRHTQP